MVSLILAILGKLSIDTSLYYSINVVIMEYRILQS